MGGAAPTPSGKGGKKPLDAQINLVPFIDLLSCCISFLLITAVWTQLARMNVTQKGQAPAGADQAPTDVPQQSLTLFIDKDGYTFAKSTGENTPIPMKGDDYDYTKLADVLKEARTDPRLPADKQDISIKVDDAVIYNKIIKTMDVCISNKFPTVSLTDKGGV